MANPVKALIVDDEADIRELIQNQLELKQIHSVEAKDGEEALQILKSQSVDLVITDLAMPRMNGFELLRRMKAQGYKIPTFILTGHADQTVAQQLKVFGIRAFINKPWTWKDLEPHIEAVLMDLRSAS